MAIVIQGFSNQKKPGYYAETVYGAGSTSAASIPLLLLLVGTMDESNGTATPDVDVVDILSADDADAAFGAGFPLARMCYKALKTKGIKIKALAITEESGADPAQATITFGGSWDKSGTYSIRVAGTRISATVGKADSLSDFATSFADAVNASNANSGRLPVEAEASGAVVTLTTKGKAERENLWILFQDASKLPVGMTAALAGGASVTGGGVYFDGATGNEDPAATLATIASTQYDRIALPFCIEADSDAVDDFAEQVNDQAGPATGMLQHVVIATADDASAVGLAQTTLNAERWQCLYQLNAESHPYEIAARMAAKRCAAEQLDPDAAYDDDELDGIAPHSQPADNPDTATQESLLAAGVTPLYTQNGKLYIARSITTHSLAGSIPDTRTLDTSDAVVPDHVRFSERLEWLSFKEANPRVGADPADEQEQAPKGVGTPRDWTSVRTAMLKRMERGDGYPASILADVDDNPPVSEWDAVNKRIMGITPVVPRPNSHQIGSSIRNVTSS